VLLEPVPIPHIDHKPQKKLKTQIQIKITSLNKQQLHNALHQAHQSAVGFLRGHRNDRHCSIGMTPCINLCEAFSSDNSSTSSNTSSSSCPLSSTAVKTRKQVPLTHYFRITPPQPKAHPITSLDSSAKPPKIRSIRQALLRYGKPRKNNLPKITQYTLSMPTYDLFDS
jgi:hypothetical protein